MSILRPLFFLLVVRPLVLIVIGLRIRNRQRLPADGPAILAANHNSHLDTLVLMSLFPLKMLPKLRPVAAADYFLTGPWMSWFSLRLMGILPISRQRGGAHDDPLAGPEAALREGAILILFPEGSRGEPERLSAFKAGIAHLSRRCPEVPVVPVFLHGLGKALPRGEALLVPFFCDVMVGEPLRWEGDRQGFMEALESRMRGLAGEGGFPDWE